MVSILSAQGNLRPNIIAVVTKFKKKPHLDIIHLKMTKTTVKITLAPLPVCLSQHDVWDDSFGFLWSHNLYKHNSYDTWSPKSHQKWPKMSLETLSDLLICFYPLRAIWDPIFNHPYRFLIKRVVSIEFFASQSII